MPQLDKALFLAAFGAFCGCSPLTQGSSESGTNDTENGSGSTTASTGSPTADPTNPTTDASTADASTTATDGGTADRPTGPDDGTESTTTSEDTSGSSGTGATDGPGCEEPMLLCGRDCVDPESDPDHCGNCDSPCGDNNATPSCNAGRCEFECLPDFDNCDDDANTQCEADLLTDQAHCGACDSPSQPEICDGVDNDCAGVVDDGCPNAVDVSAPMYGLHEIYGNEVGGAAFDDNCPAGEAVHRVTGNVGGNIDRLGAVCAALVVTPNMAGIPYTYSITAGATTLLPLHGGNVTTPFDLACPANEFVVGLSGEASLGGLHDVTIHCAALTVSGVPGSFTVSHGAVTTLTADGSNVGPGFSDQLTAPSVVTAIRGRAGAWVDALGLGESDVTTLLN